MSRYPYDPLRSLAFALKNLNDDQLLDAWELFVGRIDAGQVIDQYDLRADASLIEAWLRTPPAVRRTWLKTVAGNPDAVIGNWYTGGIAQ